MNSLKLLFSNQKATFKFHLLTSEISRSACSVSGRDAVSLNFSNHEVAFRSKKTSELFRAFGILTTCTNDTLVDNSLSLLRKGERWLGSQLFGALMRSTFYAQFVAGETGPAVKNAANVLSSNGLRLMVAPALEADLGEKRESSNGEDCVEHRNLLELIHLAQLAGASNKIINDTCRPQCLQFKMTALVPTEILVKLSTFIVTVQDKTNDYIKLIEKLSQLIENSSSDSHSHWVNLKLDKNQAHEMSLACSRLQKLGMEAQKQGVRLLVDMEWSYVNPACSALASALMVLCNRNSPVVCSTVQCYLQDAPKTLAREELMAQQLNVCYGAKLVRGAYLERERQVAPQGPCQSYEDTGRNYNKVMEQGVTSAIKAQEGRHFLIVATHNEAAVIKATQFLSSQGATQNKNVAFAQIYGMAEHVSLPLAQAGYCVYKSVAFGSLEKVLPYLARRAAENRAIMRGARRERQLLQKEISRRVKAKFNF